MSEERQFWLVVLGEGSFGLGRGQPTWRAGSHEITAEQAQEVLAWKEQNPRAQWLAVLDHEPDLLTDPPSGTLRPEDLRAGFQSGVRLKSPPASAPPPATPDDIEAPPTLFPCSWCTDSFPSSARLNRHVRAKHVLEHAHTEERLRVEFAAEEEARAAAHRIEDARPGDLRPEERPAEPPPATTRLTATEQLARLTGDL